VKPAHNTTKNFAPNLRLGCQSHRFAVNKGLSVSSGNRIIVCKKVNSASDEGMPNGPSIFAYLVFGPGGTSAEGIARPMNLIVWHGPGTRLGVQCKTRRTRPSRIRTCLGFIQTTSICNWLGEQSQDPTFAYKRLGGRSKNLSRHFSPPST
jgi:hypothetical protein